MVEFNRGRGFTAYNKLDAGPGEKLLGGSMMLLVEESATKLGYVTVPTASTGGERVEQGYPTNTCDTRQRIEGRDEKVQE